MLVFWLSIALALALPHLHPVFWPLFPLLILFTRSGWGKALLLLIFCLRLPQGWPVLQGWWENWRDRRRYSIDIYPQYMDPSRPNTLTLYAPHSSKITAHWQGNELNVPALTLGHGLFQLSVQGTLLRPGSPLEVETDGDGRRQFALDWASIRVRPDRIASLPAHGLAAVVSEGSDEILLVDRQGLRKRITCGDGPTACQWLNPEILVVATRYSRTLELYAVSTGRMLKRVSTEGPVLNLAISPDHRWLACLDDRAVEFWNLPSFTRQASIQLPQTGEYLVFSGPSLVISSRLGRSLFRCDLTKGNWSLYSAPRPLARPALGLCRGKNAGEVWMASTSAQLNGGHQKGNHYILNCLMRLDVLDWTLNTPLSTESRTAHQAGPGTIDSGCGPQGLTQDEEGRLLLVYSGTHEVERRDLQSGQVWRSSLAPNGLRAPSAVADLGQNCWLVTLPAQHALAWIREGQVERTLQLELTNQADLGEIVFYESTRSGISCQSCHTAGDSDYARHDIGGFSAWATLSCQGIEGTSPFLRDGSYSRLQDLHEVARGLYRDYPAPADSDRAESLRAYLKTLQLPDNPRSEELSRRRRGCDVFFASGCADCHQPPAFTNRASVPNQGLFPDQPQFEWLDVPSLHGLWRSAPYLHDGRAEDLDILLTEQNTKDRHGRTAHLSKQQKADLESFLKCL